MAKRKAARVAKTLRTRPAKKTAKKSVSKSGGTKPRAASGPRRREPRGGTATANRSPLAEFCRSLPGTTEDIKWGDDLVFSVGPSGGSKAGAKMYAAFDLEDSGQLGFKCSDEDFDRLTDIPGI